MTKKTIKDELIQEASKYIWSKIKFIFLMIVLIIIVKNHPGWDAFFFIILVLQFVSIIFTLLELPHKIKEQNFKENYYRNTYNTGRILFTDDISTYAQLLGINIIQDDNETIKKKYRKLAMKWHPDRFANDTFENQEIAKRNFQKVNNAYQKIKEYKNIN